MNSEIKDIKNGPSDGRKVFLKKGTCSRTFFHILNREFGHIKEHEERAADSLAGGIMQKGQQCGMLWGASLAIGAEAYRRCATEEQAIEVAIRATQKVMASFNEREKTINCRNITHCDFSSKLSFAKYVFSGRFLHCYDLAQEWAPEAVKAAMHGLEDGEFKPLHPVKSCASEVARKMGATDEEVIMVAGFAGGLGLSGAACGALSAAIWMKSLAWCKEEARKSSLKNPEAKHAIENFYKATGSKILCADITGQQFKTVDEHTDYLKNGGCDELIDVLAYL